MRIGGGKNATLSIPRDTVVNIPGHGMDKINAAYAYGGPALAIRTIEQFLGIQVNHLVEVNFDNFPQLVDALGGITYTGGCVVSMLNGGFKNGGYTLRLPAGTHHIDGKQALALARTRHNACNPHDSDLTRARRQQKILAGIKDKVTSFSTLVRLPWVSWAAPKAVRSDMGGVSLLGLVGAELTGGSKSPHVLKPSGVTTTASGGAGLTVSQATVRAAVAKFLAG
jgi:LCP family protein required for cell wall assembly